MAQPPIRAVNFCEVDGPDNSYVASFRSLNVGVAATTDIVTIYGSASKIIRVVMVVISATVAVAGAHFDVCLETRTAVFTGGASTALDVGTQDPKDPATTATNLQQFTTAPVAGALGVKLGAQKLFVPVSGAALNTQGSWNFGFAAGSKAVYLRGIAQGLAITLGGATPANATSFTGFIMYTERDN